ncbi:MAG: hypothetical protein ICV55_16490, partial [Coleofasciculus sp. C3-bin4]|nr:hypothetical protein [Coleofasciculus sp. C3-bin4]
LIGRCLGRQFLISSISRSTGALREFSRKIAISSLDIKSAIARKPVV